MRDLASTSNPLVVRSTSNRPRAPHGPASRSAYLACKPDAYGGSVLQMREPDATMHGARLSAPSCDFTGD